MSKTKLLLDVVSDLRSLADSIQAVCNAMTSEDVSPSDEKPSEQKAAPAEHPKPTVTIEQIRSVLAKKSQAGKTAEVRELLGKFGATKLSEIPQDSYPELLRATEAL
ncbi:MAG: rRNA biogenesis protein rrp5 [Clostridia bacterium]|nr:rRNA biogenesis protein rrp5 [Clostridia bacterium]